MPKRDPLETLRQMRGFAVEAWGLAGQGCREDLDLVLEGAWGRPGQRVGCGKAMAGCARFGAFGWLVRRGGVCCGEGVFASGVKGGR